MTSRTRRSACGNLSILFAVVLAVCPFTAGAEDAALHTVREGETLRDIAERFLGSPDSVPELLKYNEIANPLDVKPGTVLGIPGKPRFRALEAFAAAEEVLLRAEEAECAEYAKETYAQAQRAFKDAQNAWKLTAYLKAESLCKLSSAHAKRAIDLAEINTQASCECTVSDLFGGAKMSSDDNAGWVPLKVGMRVQLMFPDGSVVHLTEDCELGIEQLQEDRRSGRMRTSLRLFLGEVFGKIKPMGTEDSSFIIGSGASATAIRGTELRLNRESENTRAARRYSFPRTMA